MPTLDWLNRASAFTTAARVPYRLLEQVSLHTCTTPTTPTDVAPPPAQAELLSDATAAAPEHQPITDNLLIQGDNLEALKALLPFYRGEVKCIFIDPPYNTKSAFEHYDDNLEHAQWLSMMLPRLQLLRELLREDGSIWVTIDDNEGHYLKVLMDEVFGRGNFVATSIWQKKYAPKSDSKYLSESHDFVLAYGKKLDALTLNRIQKGEKQTSRYVNKDNDPRGPWKASDVLRSEVRDYAIFPVRLPSGREVLPPTGTSWRYTREKFAELIADSRIWFGADGDARPAYKRFLSEVTDSMPATTIWPFDEVGHNDESKKEMRGLFEHELFGTPKPERLLQRILHIATNEGDLVLDSFLGSGTTAAVAHKMGRRWIGIEMGEHARTHCLPRLEKVIAGEGGGISRAVGWGQPRPDGTPWNAALHGGGFRFARLGEPIFDAAGHIHPDVRFATLAAFVWQQETGTAFDPAHATPGTPHLGTHSVFDSYERLPDGRLEPISPEELPPTRQAPSIPSLQGELGLQAAGPAAPDVAAPPEPAPATVLRSRTAYYLLFNGILGDKRPASGNVLTSAVLDALLEVHARTPHPEAPLVVYGEACRLGEARLALARVTFKHIPYDVKAR